MAFWHLTSTFGHQPEKNTSLRFCFAVNDRKLGLGRLSGLNFVEDPTADHFVEYTYVTDCAGF